MGLLFLVVAAAGLFVYVKELRSLREAQWAFDSFITEVKANARLNSQEKRDHIKAMYEHNGYRLIAIDAKSITVSKKHFSLGAAMMWFGLLGVGLFVYVLYFSLKKPAVKTVFFD